MNGTGGRSSTIVRGCWSGAADDGRALLDGWRREMPPVVDGWGEQRFEDLAALTADPVEPAARLVTGGWLATRTGHAIPPAVGATLAAATFAGGRLARAALLRGAPRRRRRRHQPAAGSSSSMGNRDHAFLLHLVGVADGRHDAAAIARHQDATRAALGAELSARSYLNVLDGAARAGAAATCIDATDLEAIAAVAAAVDPDRRPPVRRRPHL